MKIFVFFLEARREFSDLYIRSLHFDIVNCFLDLLLEQVSQQVDFDGIEDHLCFPTKFKDIISNFFSRKHKYRVNYFFYFIMISRRYNF